jgi:hypothetical protein
MRTLKRVPRRTRQLTGPVAELVKLAPRGVTSARKLAQRAGLPLTTLLRINKLGRASPATEHALGVVLGTDAAGVRAIIGPAQPRKKPGRRRKHGAA